ncbi:MAG TPA: hydrolase [Candidatus Limnocylindrales bacterium]|jgi:isochorismate hydrolase|nr:hydrolase [Candidatus Limnocylindrales bacterium]
MTNQKSDRVQRAHAGLIVVDMQERLLPAMFERDRLVQNVLLLVKGSTILGIPLFATEQYRKGLGPTVPEIGGVVSEFAPVEKMAFSAAGADGFLNSLRQRKLSETILCGIEAHVCVSQTCLDLLAEGLRVFVVADAVSSRTAENHRIGLDRMRDAGALIVSTEMILFELVEKAGTDEFKQILSLVK